MKEQNNIIEVEILGFNQISMGTSQALRLNTFPSLDVWVNSKAQAKQFAALIGQKAEFVRRSITTKTGASKVVYDLNVKAISEDDLDALFQTPAFTEGTKPF